MRLDHLLSLGLSEEQPPFVFTADIKMFYCADNCLLDHDLVYSVLYYVTDLVYHSLLFIRVLNCQLKCLSSKGHDQYM
jgi:hypothetical protein